MQNLRTSYEYYLCLLKYRLGYAWIKACLRRWDQNKAEFGLCFLTAVKVTYILPEYMFSLMLNFIA